MMATETSVKKAQKRERTCSGCGNKAEPSAMVRLVLGPGGEVAVDAAGGGFGRGAHVHATPSCIAKACKGGLAKAFKANVAANADALSIEIAAAYLRRAEGLLVSARRAGAIALGADEARAALAGGAPLVVVAVDAASIVGRPEIAGAIAEGRACTWANKAELGLLLGKDEVAVCAVTDARMATALVEAVRTAESVKSLAKVTNLVEAEASSAIRREGAERAPSVAKSERRHGEEDR